MYLFPDYDPCDRTHGYAGQCNFIPPAIFPSLAILSGMGGMVFGLVRLQYPSTSHHILEHVCLWTSVFVIVTGMVILNRLSRSEKYQRDAELARNCFSVFVLPFMAIAGWPILFVLFVLGVVMMFPIMVAFVIMAWGQSHSVAESLCELIHFRKRRLVQVILFLFQSFLILASWPIFAWMLDRLEAIGIRVGMP
jgi:hypothetical protein